MKHLFIGLLLCLFVLELSGNGIAADVNLTDACNANREGSVRFDGDQLQKCDGTSWVNASSGVPKNTVAFFLQRTCPAGWYEPTVWRGLFLRAWNPSGSGPDAGRGFNTWQEDMFKSHNHGVMEYAGNEAPITWNHIKSKTNGPSGGRTQSVGGHETRPVNVSLLVCIKQ